MQCNFIAQLSCNMQNLVLFIDLYLRSIIKTMWSPLREWQKYNAIPLYCSFPRSLQPLNITQVSWNFLLLLVVELNVFLLRAFSKRLIHLKLQSVVGQKRLKNSQQGCIANTLHHVMIHPSIIRGLLSRASCKLLSILLVLLSLQNAYTTISELQPIEIRFYPVICSLP